MVSEKPRRLVVDDEQFDVLERPDVPGQYDFVWVSGPNPAYGFSSRISSHVATDDAQLAESIRGFLSAVDQVTGYIEDDPADDGSDDKDDS